MKLYLVEYPTVDDSDYDVYNSAVIAARSNEEAKEIRHGHPTLNPDQKIYWVCDKKELLVVLIGMSADEHSGVINADFNAG